VPALGRRVLAYAPSVTGLARQLALVHLYYNFCLPHAALRQPGKGQSQQECAPAMAVRLTDRVWRLEELLLIRGHRPQVQVGAKGLAAQLPPAWRMKIALSASIGQVRQG